MVQFYPFLLLCSLSWIASSAETTSDLVAEESVASDHKVQAVANPKYGYPYMIAPTLGPSIQARSDDEPEQVKPYGSRASTRTEEATAKKAVLVKKTSKAPYPQIRRQDEDVATQGPFRSYQEPKYRNFEQLEDSFHPRRMDVNARPYPGYGYSKFVPKQTHSPRDPYLSPSKEAIDSFYPSSPKVKSLASPSGYRSRNGGQTVYGAGHYDNPIRIHVSGLQAGYGLNHGGSPNYPSATGYQSAGKPPQGFQSGGGGSYGYQDYEIKSNEPIMGSIRKKLLDYAGASDLYEGEPDYLQEISRNKHKYGSIGNDYYGYGGPELQDRYRDFPYVESKISLVKKSRRI